MDVAVPKVVGVPELFVTVGLLAPIAAAPPNVRLWEPAYVVTVMLLASFAVTVRLSAAPAFGVGVAAGRVKGVAGPNAPVAGVGALVAVHARHTAVTV